MQISKQAALGIGVFTFALVVALDALTDPVLSFLLLHLVPILFVTWFAGPAWGIALALAMTCTQVMLAPGPARGDSAYLLWADVATDLVAALLLIWMQASLKKAYNRADHLARNDGLTGVLNRTGFYEVLGVEIERSKRFGKQFALVYFDCDNFKHVNDTLGHAAGDDVLKTVAAALSTTLRRVDAISRLGGDEFALLLPETDRNAAVNALDHVKQALDRAMQERQWPVTFSIGAAIFQHMPATTTQALEMADGVMYEVKKSGKNRILVRSC